MQELCLEEGMKPQQLFGPASLFLLIAFTVSAVLAVPLYLKPVVMLGVAPANSPPTANPDHYLVHRSFETPSDPPHTGVLKNDSDPDGDPLMCVFTSVATALGTATIFTNGKAAFQAASGKTGSVTIPYSVCDDHSACSSSTVTFEVVNEAPLALPDEYNVHGSFETPLDGPSTGVLKNDTDPEGDSRSCVFKQVDTALGRATIFANGKAAFNPASGKSGDVSISYTVCDDLGACSEGLVTFHVVNQSPIAGADVYEVRGSSFETPLETPNGVFKNDSDPDGDLLQTSAARVDYPQGVALLSANGKASFIRNAAFPDYAGTFTISYQLCDNLGACSVGDVTFRLIGDGENDGSVSCHSRVGAPINVTNGNMYLRQEDYALPAVGPALDITRTYNSNSQRIGLFGRGWSTDYDQSIAANDSNLARYSQSDGRAIYLARTVGSTGSLLPLEGDFHGSLVQNGGSGFALTMKDGTVRQFNSSGKLVSVADRAGNQTTLAYDAGGKLVSGTDPFGRVLSFTTNANGQVLSISDSLGTIATYAYDGSSRLLSVVYADHSAYQFGYTSSNRLSSVTDALGNLVESHTYDSQGRAVTSERQGGVERVSLNYLSASETDVTDALTHVTKFTIDRSRGRNVVTRVAGVCSCGGAGSQIQNWSYDSRLNVTTKSDALNHVVSYSYDANDNRLSETDGSGTATYSYNALGEVLTVTDKLNGVTSNTYDAAGNLLTTKDALNNTTAFTYNGHGQILTATDARGKVTNFVYDATGNLVQSRDANGVTTFYFYDARSRLTKVRDALSRTTIYAYDAAGRVNKITHPDLSFVTFNYDLAGRRTSVIDERGNATNYSYDGAYRLTAVTDALSHATTYAYDSLSQATSTTDALGRVTNYEYDDFQRLKKIVYPPASAGAPRLFASFAYDAAGNVTQHTDTAARVTSYAYDNVARLASTTDANNQTTRFEYDALNRQTALSDALNQRYQFAYDALGRQIQFVRGGVSLSYNYDAVGNLTQRTDYNGAVTNYVYDNLNRLTTVAYPTRSATFAYDPLGNLTRATNENGSVYLSYDNRYRLSTVSDPFNYGVSYNYDAAGNPTRLSLNYATYASYTYDAVNRLTNIKDAANQSFPHGYDAVNRLTARVAPNGITANYSYDDLNRLTALTHSSGANLVLGNQYTYNDAHNISGWTNASGTHAYEYDPLNRLATVANSAQTHEAYAYDAVGNRIGSHASLSYNYQPFNKLASTDTETYSYDNNGNLLTRADGTGTTTFGWNEENQLTQVALPTGVTVNYKYDALGRRLQRTSSAGANERYVYDGPDVLVDLNADWTVASSYLNGPGMDNHLRQTSSVNGVSYFLVDHLGSTAGITDAAGNVVEQFNYDSFGKTDASARTRYGYTGRELDPDTGLMYYRARWYDPGVGRFISEDPIGLLAGPNAYSYAGNNPIWANDPSGLASILVVVGARSNGGAGGAYIMLLDKNGRRISFRDCDCSDDDVATGLAIARDPNRMLGNGVGDTPFGVYAFTGTQGGSADWRDTSHPAGFGTGKVLLDPLFGEVVDGGRSLIRLHGGGTDLADPYDLDQALRPTQGCVRMKNGEVNSLIEAIDRLPQDDRLKFVFIGDAGYLNGLAVDPARRNTGWQIVLRTNLGLP
jgi:RHS repeat-associated protein